MEASDGKLAKEAAERALNLRDTAEGQLEEMTRHLKTIMVTAASAADSDPLGVTPSPFARCKELKHRGEIACQQAQRAVEKATEFAVCPEFDLGLIAKIKALSVSGDFAAGKEEDQESLSLSCLLRRKYLMEESFGGDLEKFKEWLFTEKIQAETFRKDVLKPAARFCHKVLSEIMKEEFKEIANDFSTPDHPPTSNLPAQLQQITHYLQSITSLPNHTLAHKHQKPTRNVLEMVSKDLLKAEEKIKNILSKIITISKAVQGGGGKQEQEQLQQHHEMAVFTTPQDNDRAPCVSLKCQQQKELQLQLQPQQQPIINPRVAIFIPAASPSDPSDSEAGVQQKIEKENVLPLAFGLWRIARALLVLSRARENILKKQALRELKHFAFEAKQLLAKRFEQYYLYHQEQEKLLAAEKLKCSRDIVSKTPADVKISNNDLILIKTGDDAARAAAEKAVLVRAIAAERDQSSKRRAEQQLKLDEQRNELADLIPLLKEERRQFEKRKRDLEKRLEAKRSELKISGILLTSALDDPTADELQKLGKEVEEIAEKQQELNKKEVEILFRLKELDEQERKIRGAEKNESDPREIMENPALRRLDDVFDEWYADQGNLDQGQKELENVFESITKDLLLQQNPSKKQPTQKKPTLTATQKKNSKKRAKKRAGQSLVCAL